MLFSVPLRSGVAGMQQPGCGTNELLIFAGISSLI